MHLTRKRIVFDSTGSSNHLTCLDDRALDVEEYEHFITIEGGIQPQIKGSVYISSIEEMPGYYKIGISTDVFRRLQGYNSAYPLTIRLEYSLTCGNYKALEHLLHQRFRKQHVKGEWYFLSEDEVVDCISFLNEQ